MPRPSAAAFCPLLAALFLSACGYRATNHVDSLPPDVHTIAIPGFANRTRIPRLSQTVTAAVVDELVRRTRYRVQPQISGSNAILRGAVTAFDSTPVTFDPTNGHATTVEIAVHVSVALVDNLTGKDLYRNDDLVFHDQYQISSNAATLFEEDPAAFDRLAHAVAADIVSAILEAF